MKKFDIVSELKRLDITQVTNDSRLVQPGGAFVAIEGKEYDGRLFIKDAIAKGAAVVIMEERRTGARAASAEGLDGIYLIVKDARKAFAEAMHYLYPETPKYVVAVTGTNGKTSVVNYFRQICELLGLKAASLGTLGFQSSDTSLKKKVNVSSGGLTTPGISTNVKIMHTCHKNGVTHFAFEASSHGLNQKRLHGIGVHAAALVSLTHDHLDYHKTFSSYKKAKLALFSDNLNSDGVAIINSEIEDFEEVKDFICKNMRAMLSVGKDGEVNIFATQQSILGQQIEFTHFGKYYTFNTNIIGSFQATNLLIAALLVEKCDVEFKKIMKVLHKVQAAPGRLQRVTDIRKAYHVFIDYAHTPDALKQVLSELRKLCSMRLIVVFGCGGDRDKSKRPLMGEVAANLADLVIITDDNPRTENAAKIRKAILATSHGAIEIPDREAAIKYAIENMNKGDVLLIAGKGHEDYQIIGTTKIAFDDALVAKKYLCDN